MREGPCSPPRPSFPLGRAMSRSRAALLLCAAAPCLALKPLDATKTCNGDPGLCELRVDQVTWSGTHNTDALNLQMRPVSIGCVTDNHEHHMIWELDQGLRFFDMDTCLQGDHVVICHGPAMGKAFGDEMRRVKAWMDANPREVVLLSFGDVVVQGDQEAGKRKLMELLTTQTKAIFGGLLYTPPMKTGELTHGWPKLGHLVSTNKRMLLLWGKTMYYRIYKKDDTVPGFRDQHIWFQRNWATTYGSDYKTMMPAQLSDKLEHFCDVIDKKKYFNKHQYMILVDGYLTISPTRPSWSFCNKDLAGDVNVDLLAYDHLESNPLLLMQDNCWKKEKQVSLLAVDFTEYFPQRLDRMGTALNEKNFARFGWIGGKMSVSGAVAGKTEPELQALIAKLGGVGNDRITVDKKETIATGRRLQGANRSLAASALVHFSVGAPAVDALKHSANVDVLKKIKTASAGEAGVDSVTAECRDPGVSTSTTRDAPVRDYFDEGHTIHFTCKTGLVPHGSLTRTCGPDGLFTGIQPHCLEAWTKKVRLWPLWLKIFLIILAVLAILCCCGGLIFLCCRMCKKRGYTKVENTQ